VQLCGDAHLSNFGVFASPERQLMFDLNDFDETLPGPWEWDVKRLAASFEVAGRDLGFSPSDRRAIVQAGVREYRERMREAATMRTLDAWYAHMNVDEVMGLISAEVSEKRLGKKEQKGAARDIAKARTRDCLRVHSKRTGSVDGQPRIVADPPLIMPIEDLLLSASVRRETEKSVETMIRSYRRSLAREHHPIEEFRYVYMARKVVGVGSVGTRCWIFLMEGRDHKDPLFLQAKEAQASVLERFLGPSEYRNHGQRIVAGQHLMQAATDIFLGWQRVKDLDGQTRDYYIRQFHDWKGSVQVDRLRVPGVTLYARLEGVGSCARPLGRQDRHRVLPGPGRLLRPGDRGLLRLLRRPERAGLRGPRQGGEIWPPPRADRAVAARQRASRGGIWETLRNSRLPLLRRTHDRSRWC
jgi:hypothetical protein